MRALADEAAEAPREHPHSLAAGTGGPAHVILPKDACKSDGSRQGFLLHNLFFKPDPNPNEYSVVNKLASLQPKTSPLKFAKRWLDS